MQKKARWFVALGTVLILLVTAGIYINYKMNQIVKIINRPGILFSDTSPSTPVPDTGAEDSGAESESPGIITPGPATTDGIRPLPQKQSPSSPDKLDQDDIVKGVQQKVTKPIEKKDLFKAGLIIIRRLNWSEIEYMYDVGTKDSITRADLKEVHRILRLRLSSDEIQVMQDLGRKYGKNLDFLSAKTL
ncbi:MAG TPA: hypothetical protein GXX58_06780 [Gelria sp.]|jgi:hypothetical protein|nr:hypothetical protein [Gelria sp.]